MNLLSVSTENFLPRVAGEYGRKVETSRIFDGKAQAKAVVIGQGLKFGHQRRSNTVVVFARSYVTYCSHDSYSTF